MVNQKNKSNTPNKTLHIDISIANKSNKADFFYMYTVFYCPRKLHSIIRPRATVTHHTKGLIETLSQ
jgi:hypothetical protein